MKRDDDSGDMREFARAYFDEWRIAESGTRAERLAMEYASDRASDRLADISSSREAAERAWPLILFLVDHAPDEMALHYVAAGPLEDLVRTHGDLFADRIVDRARQDERFRVALRGVWGWETVSDELRLRVSEVIGPLT